MALVAIVTVAALAVAAVSLARLSRLPQAPPEPPAARTFETAGAGDVVVLPGGDYLVESRSVRGREPAATTVLALRDGRARRWLVAPREGPVRLLEEEPADGGAAGGEAFDRAEVWVLPGA